MAVDLDYLFDQDVFLRMQPEKREVFYRFASRLDEVRSMQIVPTFLQFKRELNRFGPMDEEEKDEVIDAIADSLDGDEQTKYWSIIKMLDNYI
ncbi:MAG: hypothetical protein LBL96_05870 [Clostridiales bacterium]|jgi:hypothetical protein|nr:hypothetical protein [Clostridiales bacterium]